MWTWGASASQHSFFSVLCRLALMNDYLPHFYCLPRHSLKRKRSYNLVSSNSSDMNRQECVFVTHIRVTDIQGSALGCTPTGFHVVVNINGKDRVISSNHVPVEKDTVEWDEEILLPSELSSSISFRVYASFEPGSEFKGGQLLGRFKITVGDVLDSGEQLQTFRLFVPGYSLVFPLCASLRLITERRPCDVDEPTERLDLKDSLVSIPPKLSRFTDAGHQVLIRYLELRNRWDLNETISCFERVLSMCPKDDLNHPVALSNLATTKFIHYHASNDLAILSESIALYRDTLYLCTSSHPDYCITTLDLAFTLLVRYKRQGDEVDKNEAKNVLSRMVELFPVGSSAHRAGSLALQIAGLSVLVPTTEFGIPKTDTGNLDHEELIRIARALWLSLRNRDPRPLPLLSSVGRLSCHHLDCSHYLIQDREAMVILEDAVEHASDEHPDKPTWLDVLGSSLSRRFRRYGELPDIVKSVSMAERALYLTLDSHPCKPARLNNLGEALSRRFQRLGELADINLSVSMLEKALYFTADGHPDKSARLHNLASSLLLRFERIGDLADMNKTVSTIEEALCLTHADHPDKPSRLKCLGNALHSRFKRLDSLVDLNKSISVTEEAICLIQDDHPDKAALLNNLGTSLSARFNRLGDLADINRAISVLEESLHLTPDDHPHKPSQLRNLGMSLLNRFRRLGGVADINKSIEIKEEAVRLTPKNHPKRPAWLNDLAVSLYHRFEHFGDVEDINKCISMAREAICLTPDDNRNKSGRLLSLGVSLCRRFDRIGDPEDINQSISTLEHALRLVPKGHPKYPGHLSSLGSSLSSRFSHLWDPVDINRAISVQEEALSLLPIGHPEKPAWLSIHGISLLNRFKHFGNIKDMNNSISVKEEAVRLTQNGHPNKPAWLNNLGTSFIGRFEHTGDLSDVNKAISIFEEAVSLTPDGNPNKSTWVTNLGTSLSLRFEHFGDLADLDKSILMKENAVRLTFDGFRHKPASLNNLAASLAQRWERLGDLDDLNKSISMLEDAAHLTPDHDSSKASRLSNLGALLCSRFERLGDLTDVQKSISMLEKAMCLLPDHHPNRPRQLSSLGVALCRRFQRLGDLADIKNSISSTEEALRLTPNDHPDRLYRLRNLGTMFMQYYRHFGGSSALTAAISHFSLVSRSSTGPTYTRFRAALDWVSAVAHLQGRSEVFQIDACATAIGILPELAWVGLPLVERHRVLSEAADVARDAAATALVFGLQTEKAVEWLEQGRSIVWEQLLQLRAPIDELRAEHPDLAEQFQKISREVEHASHRESGSSYELEDNELVNPGSASVEKAIQKHHELALTRERLLVNIRSLPGFDRFLLPKTINQLAPLAHSGLVVYLNASEHRCDALIVRAESRNVIHAPLPGIRYPELQQLHSLLRLLLKQKRLIISREEIHALICPEEKPSSSNVLRFLLEEDGTQGNERAVKIKPQKTEGYSADTLFQRILAYLWKEVIIPVFRALGFATMRSRADKMTRIFWCPTGPFAFLPIHAAGLYGTGEPGTKLSDFVISSYIPALGTLAPSLSGKNSNHLPSSIRLLTVPQPRTDGLAWLPLVENEIDHIRTLSAGSPFVTLEESDSTIEDVMEKMKHSDWVHFACHGVQDPDDPLDSGLCLANGRRLKLSDIIRLSRPRGGLAFLSACQTAQGDEKLSEESVHLASGMLLAGYGSVIATMWAIQDPDAPKVTSKVYEHLFRRDDGKVPDSIEAAEALHCAVQHLRDTGASFTSWVPFIHMGR